MHDFCVNAIPVLNDNKFYNIQQYNTILTLIEIHYNYIHVYLHVPSCTPNCTVITVFSVFTMSFLRYNAPINGLPQDGGVGQPRGIRLRKAHMGWDFDITAIPRVGNLTRPPS